MGAVTQSDGKDLNVCAFQIIGAVNERLRPVDVGTYTLDSKNWDITMAYKQQIASQAELENIRDSTAAGVEEAEATRVDVSVTELACFDQPRRRQDVCAESAAYVKDQARRCGNETNPRPTSTA